MNTQQPPFTPVQYIPAKEKESVLNLPITSLTAIAHEPLPQGGNHWSIYLSISERDYVRLDMTPSYIVPATVNPGGSKGILIVSHVDDARLGMATKVVRLDVRGGLKGCRFWVYHQIGLFWDEGLVVDGGQVEEVRRAILVMYPEMVEYRLVVGDGLVYITAHTGVGTLNRAKPHSGAIAGIIVLD
ncbi:hypothetical protein BDV24DRAFT_161137 [Aspergillus arachidicola]|uniref:DUF7770 domain-containing protein n=1 Tax=Aspergillus arachidicola TaxID=656916 RepID=A0A5N6YEF2_9EURO|nr:hypothetical protein BDV24DRAFT_161137 [Aspergillus arachidicola]